MNPLKPTTAQERENKDPDEQVKPVPFILLMIITGLFTFGVVYISSNDLTNNPNLGDHRLAEDMAPPAKNLVVNGAELFTANCATCHQATGIGVPGAFPPLAGSEWVNGKPEAVIQILLHGIKGSIAVKGETFNGEMPDFGAKFSNAEIAAVANHIRSSWGNKGTTIDESTVDKARALTKYQAKPWVGGAELERFK